MYWWCMCVHFIQSQWIYINIGFIIIWVRLFWKNVSKNNELKIYSRDKEDWIKSVSQLLFLFIIIFLVFSKVSMKINDRFFFFFDFYVIQSRKLDWLGGYLRASIQIIKYRNFSSKTSGIFRFNFTEKARFLDKLWQKPNFYRKRACPKHYLVQ